VYRTKTQISSPYAVPQHLFRISKFGRPVQIGANLIIKSGSKNYSVLGYYAVFGDNLSQSFEEACVFPYVGNELLINTAS